MPPSSRRRRCTYSRRSELNVARQKQTRLRLPGLARPRAIAHAIEIARVMEIAKAHVAAASIVATAVIAVAAEIGNPVASAKASIAIEALTVAIVVEALTVGAPTAAVVRDVIAIARERTERTFPPGWWLG